MEYRRTCVGVLCLVLVLGVRGAAAECHDAFNVAVGTQTFGPRYAFSSDTRLVETAEAIYAMGSDIIKMDMSWRSFDAYLLTGADYISNLVTMASYEPSYQHVFNMPFSYYLLWAYSMGTNINWHDGMDVGEVAGVYEEISNLTARLLIDFNDSGKSFFLGHWEGDWALLDDRFDPNLNPSNAAIQGMIDWLTARQRAVNDARASVIHTNVNVYHYAEVNLVKKAMDGGTTMVNNVLPFCTNDLVSYSAYDIQSDPDAVFTAALAYVESKAPTTSLFDKDVFIGEYGIPADPQNYTLQEQADLAEDVIKKAVSWGCPFVLNWQMYSNETNKDGSIKGFWLIDDTNTKVPCYYVHQDYLGRAHAFKNVYRFWLGRNPDAAAFASFGADFTGLSISNLVRQVIDSGEFASRWSDEEYLTFIFGSLFGSTTTADADYQACRTMLAGGTNRSDLLCGLLDGDRFTNCCPNQHYAEMLLGGTLRRARLDPGGSAVTSLVARLVAGEPRSALWSECLATNEFYAAELDLRDVHAVDAPEIFTKYFFSYDRDGDGMNDAWERQVVQADGEDGFAAIEDVTPATDFDGDGLPDGGEFAAGSDPLDEDSDDDGLEDGVEVDAACAVIDPLDNTTNLTALLNTRVERWEGGRVAFVRTNSSSTWTDAVVDWQPGGANGTYLSLTSTPVAVIEPAGALRDGGWQVEVQFFDAGSGYLGEPNWIPYGAWTHTVRTNVAELAAQHGLAAAGYRLRFRIGPSDNGDTEPGFLFTRIAALQAGATDPRDPDTDGDGFGDGGEAIAGTDANDATDFLRLESVTGTAPNGQLVTWQGTTGREYRVHGGTNLAAWSLVHEATGTVGTMSYTNTAPDSPAYFRLAVSRE